MVNDVGGTTGNTVNQPVLENQDQGLCSLSGKTSYRKISWSLEAAKLHDIVTV